MLFPIDQLRFQNEYLSLARYESKYIPFSSLKTVMIDLEYSPEAFLLLLVPNHRRGQAKLWLTISVRNAKEDLANLSQRCASGRLVGSQSLREKIQRDEAYANKFDVLACLCCLWLSNWYPLAHALGGTENPLKALQWSRWPLLWSRLIWGAHVKPEL